MNSWRLCKSTFRQVNAQADPRVRSARDMINAIFSSSICKPLAVSSALPKNYPLWKRVYNTFARWCQRSVWEVLLALLRQ